MAKPLRALYQKNAKFIWSNEHSQAFEKIKTSLITKCLAHFDPKQTIELWVDASTAGIGAFLINRDKNNKRRLVSCASKTFDKAEENLSMVEKEGLALTWSVLRMNVELVKSEDNIADYVSRCLNENTDVKSEILIKNNNTEVLENVEKQIAQVRVVNNLFKVITVEQLAKATQEDKTLKQIKEAILKKHTHLPKDKQFNFFRDMLDTMSIVEGMLTRFNGDQEVIILPDNLIQNAIAILHEGHMKTNSVKKLMKSMYLFKGMDKAIEEYISFCLPCQANTNNTHFEPNISSVLPNENMEALDIDNTSVTPGGDYALVAICERSRYPEVVKTKSLTTDSAINALNKIFKIHGKPKRIKCDNGPAFKSKNLKNRYGQEPIQLLKDL